MSEHEKQTLTISLVLRPAARNDAGRQRVLENLAALGATTATSGAATVTARVTVDVAREQFGLQPTETPRTSPSRQDFGAATGWEAGTGELPPTLAEDCDGVEIVPPATRF